jgi:predicted phosphodiesterase
MTIRERYYDRIVELLRKEPQLLTRQVIARLRYKGNHESFRMTLREARRELGIFIKHGTRHNKLKSATDIIEASPEMEDFTDLMNEAEEFTDGEYLNTEPFLLSPGRKVLVMNDQHIGCHSTRLCMLPLEYTKANRTVDTIILNGDLADCEAFSAHGAIPGSKVSFAEEKRQVVAYLTILRKTFPNAEIIYAFGNHEYRAQRYILNHAKAFEGCFELEKQFELSRFDITYVPYHKFIRMGDLNIMHGHHIKGSGTNVAATLLTKAGCNIMFGDRHRSQEAFKRRLDGSVIGAWAVGCLCPLSMPYSLFNPDWTNGFAYVESEAGGLFNVENKSIINGKIY